MKLYGMLVICLIVLTNGGFFERVSADTLQSTFGENGTDVEADRWSDGTDDPADWWDKYDSTNPETTAPTTPNAPTNPGTGEGQWIWGIWVPAQDSSTGGSDDPPAGDDSGTGDDSPSTEPGTVEGQWIWGVWVPARGDSTGGSDEPGTGDDEWWNNADNDDDGYTMADGDCDDNDPDIYPGAEEICDGKDNNCDGVIDEGCKTCTDNDGDGFYAESMCGTAVDCDDNDPDINPWASEICGDGKDNNCDGVIDEGCPTCTDNDGDAFYAEAGCGTPVDCDDNDPDVYPGAPEICGDGIDQDCDFFDEPCARDNTPPGAPIAIEPDGDSEMSLTPLFRIEEYFNDIDSDIHVQTRWLIATDRDDPASVFVDEISTTQLYNWQIPSACILENDTQYYWAARVYDGKDWSNVSEICSFTTGIQGPEFENGIGIDSAIGPDEEIILDGPFIDENGEMVLSDTQKVFKSVSNPDIQIGMKVEQGCIIDKVCTRRPEDFVTENGADIPEMPYGVIDFKIIVPEKGDTVTVTFYFSEPLPEGFRWWKYDPKEGGFYDVMDKEFLYSAAGVLSASSDGKKVILEMTDGGNGDLIEAPDGKIYGSSGFGPPASAVPSSSGGGGGGSCFIRSLMF